MHFLLHPVSRSLFCMLWACVFFPGWTVEAYAGVIFQAAPADVIETLNTTVTAIKQDEKGFMWIGTDTGAFRYDGARLLPVAELDSRAGWLARARIHDIVDGDANEVWIVSEKGIGLWNVETGLLDRLNLPVEPVIVTPAGEGTRTYLLAASHTVYFFDRGRMKVDEIASTDALPASPAITALYQDNSGRVWVGTDAGLYCLDGISGMLHSVGMVESGLSSPGISWIAEDAAGTAWVGAPGVGLFRISATGHQMPSLEQGVSQFSDATTLFHVDPDTWLVGTSHHGVFSWNPIEQRMHTGPDGRALGWFGQETITTLYLDKTGVLWAGTRNGVLRAVFEPVLGSDPLFSRLIAGLDLRNTKSIVESKDGCLWIATFGQGVFHVDPRSGEVTSYRKDLQDPHSLVDDRIISMAVDRDGHAWIATNAGLSKYDPMSDAFKTYLSSPGNEAFVDYLILQDVFISEENEVFVVTAQEGILKYNEFDDRFEHWPPDSDQGEASRFKGVQSMTQDRGGRFWMATGSEGLIGYDHEHTAIRAVNLVYDPIRLLSGQNVVSVMQHSNGELWAGTNKAGAYRMHRDGEQIARYTIQKGLPGNDVVCILEDARGYVWLASKDGIARVDVGTDRIVKFDIHDGLTYNQVHYNACFRQGNRLYLGTNEGVTIINTEDIEAKLHDPEVQLVSVHVGEESYPYADPSRPIILDKGQNSLQFEFMVPDYLYPGENKIVYRLAELESAWTEAPVTEAVLYNDLEPGTYRLQVMGANHRGVLSEPQVYSIQVAAFAWWPWGAGAAGVLLLALLFGFMARSLHSAKKRIEDLEQKYQMLRSNGEHNVEHVRSQIARDLHDDLGSDLSRLVVSLQNRLQRSDLSDFSLEWTQECWEYAQRVTQEVKYLSWTVDPDRNWLPDLVDRICHEAHEVFDEDHVDFKTHRMPRIYLSPIARKDIFLIFREALTNISDHASATDIFVSVEYKEELLTLIVEDNGIGFDEDKVQEGSGLKNMRKRAENLNASLSWKNKPEGGTRVILLAPIT